VNLVVHIKPLDLFLRSREPALVPISSIFANGTLRLVADR